jgi:hypothetical protein
MDRLRLCRVAAAVATYAASSRAYADAISEFYNGRTISIMVGFGPGGGYNVYARGHCAAFRRACAGSSNGRRAERPWCGGLGARQLAYNVSPRDGTVFGTFNRTIPLEPLLDGARAQFDPLKFNWLGSPSNEVSACVGWHGARAKIAAVRYSIVVYRWTQCRECEASLSY